MIAPYLVKIVREKNDELVCAMMQLYSHESGNIQVQCFVDLAVVEDFLVTPDEAQRLAAQFISKGYSAPFMA